MEEIAKKSTGIIVGAWITIILGTLLMAGAAALIPVLLNADTVELPVAVVAGCVVFIALFAGFDVYYFLVLVKYYRAPKTVITREGESLKFFDAKNGWVTVATKDIASASVQGTLMKSSLINVASNKADGDLIITAAGVQYKVLNVKNAEGAAKKLLEIAEEGKIKASLGM